RGPARATVGSRCGVPGALRGDVVSAARGRRPGQVLLLSALRTRRRTWPPLLMWSAVEVAPPLVSGIAVAGATDRFLRGDIPGAFQMLALLLAAALVAALA